jgi:hypothetical protein
MINILKELYIKKSKIKHPLIPEYAIAVPKYTDKTANGLTKCIVDFLNMSGHQAERISNTGRYIDNKKVVTDVIGIKRTIGSGKYIKGTGTNGTADISSTIQVKIAGRKLGLSVKWEVKIGKDRQSTAQKEYQQHIESTGGIYHVVKDFEDFYKKYRSIVFSSPNEEPPF